MLICNLFWRDFVALVCKNETLLVFEARGSAFWKFAEPHFAFVKPLGAFSSSSCICLKFTSHLHHERGRGIRLNWLVRPILCPDVCTPLIYNFLYLLSISFVVNNYLTQGNVSVHQCQLVTYNKDGQELLFYCKPPSDCICVKLLFQKFNSSSAVM